MLRAQQRDLGFGDLRRRGAERAHELQDRALRRRTRARCANSSSNATSAVAEAALERARVGEPGRPPDARARSVDVDPGALGDLRERRPCAVGPDELRSAAKLSSRSSSMRLHDLGDRRADLVGEEAQAARGAASRVRARPGRRARRRRSRRVIVHRAHRERTRGRRSAFPRARAGPMASNGAGGSASNASPAPPAVDHCGSSAGARSSMPAGRVPEQRGPGAVPAHRERERPGAQRQVVHGERSGPSHSGGKSGQQVDAVVRARARAPAAARARNSAGSRRASSARDVVHASRPGARRRAARRAAPAELRTTLGRFGVEAPVFERGDDVRCRRRASSRSARAASTLALPRRRAARPAVPRSSWRVPARARRRRHRRACRTSSGSPRRARRAARVRCGTGTSSAISIGASHGSTASGCDRRPVITISRVDGAAGPQPRRARRASAPARRRRARRRAVEPRPAPRCRSRTTNASEHGAGDAFSTSTTIAPDPPASRRRTRAARRRRSAPAPPSRRPARPRPPLPRRRVVGRHVPAVVGADPPVERDVAVA